MYQNVANVIANAVETVNSEAPEENFGTVAFIKWYLPNHGLTRKGYVGGEEPMENGRIAGVLYLAPPLF